MKLGPIGGFMAAMAVAGALVGWVSLAPVNEGEIPLSDAVVAPRAVDNLAKERDAAPVRSDETATILEKTGQSRLQSHRAVYKIILKSAEESSGIGGISGDMRFSFRDRCDGWTIENNSSLNVQYVQGAGITQRESFVTWESKNGRDYRFRVRRFVDDRLTDNIKGEASMPVDASSKAIFTKPEATAIDLHKDVRFPSGYLRDLISAASHGETIVSRRVFEGDKIESPYLVSAVISPAKGETSSPIARAMGLSDARSWTFRLAYFREDNRSPEPEFELRMVYRADGIADKIIQDFGDYVLSFELLELEALPQPDC